jgi:CRISPR system Cascade subunit CasE
VALRAAFGTAAPQPFRLLREGKRLLGYCSDIAALNAMRALPALDSRAEAVRAALALDSFAAKPMPAFPQGVTLDFEVRLRPVRRAGADKRSADRPGEHDAFGLAVRGRPREEWPRREDVYLAFAREKLEANGAITLAQLALTSMTRTEVARSRHDGGAPRKRIDGPDITALGRLVVNDPDAFAALLARGVGRHRAFGFGMLLLRPPRR